MPLFGHDDKKKDEEKKATDDAKGDDTKGNDDKKGDAKAATSGDAKTAPSVCNMKRGDYQIHVYIEQAKEIKMEEAHTVDPIV